MNQPSETETVMDDDAVVACADIVRRSGAIDFEIGYLRDDVPADQAGWYARACYSGDASLQVEERRAPDEAADALARRVLQGGRCTHCDRTVTLSGNTTRKASRRCRWTRIGRTWTRGCQTASDTHDASH